MRTGASLSVVDAVDSWERRYTRFPGLEIANPRSQIQFNRRFGSRALAALPVKW